MGLPGFPDSETFVLLDHRPGSVFRWLQSCDEPGLAFVVIDPLLVDRDYPVDAVRRGLGFAEVDPAEDVVVLAICTVPHAPDTPTANMLAPVGIGLQTRRGGQVVLHDRGLGPRESFLDRIAAA